MKMNIRNELMKLQDAEYKDFHCRLIPTVDPSRVIGVRIPELRAFAKRISFTEEAKNFLKEDSHKYYDEINLHGALIDYGQYSMEETLSLIEAFLPMIDNWATCDMFVPHIFKTYPSEVLPLIKRWLCSDHIYTIRFGINCLIRDFMQERFDPIQFEWINAIDNDDYYVKMGIAWYYSVALVKQWDQTLPLIKNGLKDSWIQNKTIQKAKESDHLTKQRKEYLSRFKSKESKK